jgi:hypothetical protein
MTYMDFHPPMGHHNRHDFIFEPNYLAGSRSRGQSFNLLDKVKAEEVPEWGY